MEVITDPIPHIVTSLHPKVYAYCIDNWKRSDDVNHENRYNTTILDTVIVQHLNNTTAEAYRLLLPYLKEVYPNWSPSKLRTRCQFAGNLISDEHYAMRDWHLDNGNKVLIGLWYFKHPDDSNEGGLHISDGVNEKLIPYQENAVVFLPNLPNAWHKVGERSTWTHERRFINIVVEQQEYLHDYRRGEDGSDRMKPVRNLML